MNNAHDQLAQTLLSHCTKAGIRIATAESCTGGWIAKIMTDLPGSSMVFERGFVTYSNEAKMEMLGVSATTLEQYGAVSEKTVQEMVTGALLHSSAHLAVAVSGIAGPGGGNQGKPVGTVWFAWGKQDDAPIAERHRFYGNRQIVRHQAVTHALSGLLKIA